MLIKKISNIYDDNFSQIIFSVVDNKFNTNFFFSDKSDITTLTGRANSTHYVHNKTNPTQISYKSDGKNIVFTGDIYTTIEALKNGYFISEELYSHLREDKELNAYITREKLEIKKSASENQPVQDTNTTSSQMAFFKSAGSAPPSPKSSTTNSSTSSTNSSISSSEIEEIQQIQERILRLSDKGKKLFLENLTKTINKDDGSKIKPISVNDIN